MKKIDNKNKEGISIIEILVVVTIIVIGLAGLLGSATYSLKISTILKETNEANSIAQETIEAVRNFRDGTNWSINGLGILTTDIDYFPQKSGSPPKWQLVLGAETIGIFNRKVVFSEVFRDTSDNIVKTGGTDDPNTRKVVVTVNWKNKEVKITSYLTNWR